MIETNRMPILFCAHGSPMNAIANNDYTNALSNLKKNLPAPKAILMISAHWMTEGTLITAMPRPKTIHDFYGFPKELFDVQYNAPGNPELANAIINKISFPTINADTSEWGLDHGTWSVLKHIYPEANIPVIQLSLDMTKPNQFHFDLGSKLKYLREEGVLIIASGNIVHNLRRVDWNENAAPHDFAVLFDRWVQERAEKRDFTALVHDFTLSQSGQLSNPSLEHYLPFLYILGAVYDTDILSYPFEGFQNASMSMRTFMWS